MPTRTHIKELRERFNEYTDDYIISKFSEFQSLTDLSIDLCCSGVFLRKELEKRKIKIPSKYRLAYDFIGKSFGFITVLSSSIERYKKRKIWHCQCICEKLINLTTTQLTFDTLESCGCMTPMQLYFYKIFGEISLGNYITPEHWGSIKSAAFERNIPFLITREEAFQKFLDQKQICVYTGRFLSLGISDKKTASLDRIDSFKPYEISNIQWTYTLANIMKYNLTEERFLEICKKVALIHGKEQ